MIVQNGKASLYGGSYMWLSCGENAKLYSCLPAGFAFANSNGKEVAATGNTLSNVHIVSHTEHQKGENGVYTICGACEHPADKVDTETFRCSQCGRTMLARVEQGENVRYFPDLNEVIQKAEETDGCTLKLLANAGTLTVSKGAFTLDLNGKTADSFTVSGGSVKLANAKEIGTLTVSGDVTLASLLPEGYAFCNSLYNWYSTNDLVERTSLSDVSVRQIPLKDLTVTLEQDSFEYDGTAKTPTVSEVKLGETVLTKDTDYTVAVAPQTNVGSGYAVVVTGKGNYSGTASASWSITAKTVENPTIELSGGPFTYDNGNEIKQTVTVKDGKTVIPVDEYTVAYTNNVNIGTATTVKIVDNSKTFTDTENHWSRDEVNFVASREIFNGIGNNLVAPTAGAERAQVAAMMSRFLKNVG